MVFLRLFSLVVLAAAVYGQAPISCPGVALIRVGCFKSVNPKVSTPSLLFTNKVNYRLWDSHLRNIVCQCVAKRGKSNIVGIRNIGECRIGNLYAKEGSAPFGQCNTWGAKPCTKGVDCVGNSNTIFVYRVQLNTTPKPTTKPTTKKPTATKPTTPSKSSPENLQCFSYSIKMKLVKPPAGGKGSPAYSKMQCSICKTIRTIYRCYPCYQSVHFINVTTSNKETSAHLVLKFGCKQAHLKPLISKLQKGAIISATCQDGQCPQTPLLAQTVPGCSMVSACPVMPACSVPVCGAPLPPPPPPPAPMVYTCPVSCSSTCAPACTTTCCQAITAASKKPKKATKPQKAQKAQKAKPKAAKKPLVLNDGTPLYDYSLVD